MHSNILPAGKPAPDFELHATPDQKVSLSDFRGRPVVLAFYPADFSPVCGDQMALYNEMLNEFQELEAELVGLSVDGAWCHAAEAAEAAGAQENFWGMHDLLFENQSALEDADLVA